MAQVILEESATSRSERPDRIERHTVLVAGDYPPGYLDRFAGIAPIHSPPERFAALFLFPGDDYGPVLDRLIREAPLVPLIDLSGRSLPRADFCAPAATWSAVHEGWEKASAILARLKQLPALPDEPDREPLTACYLAFSRGGRVLGRIDAAHPEMVSYPLLQGLARPREILEGLAESGLLERQFLERMNCCDRCGSARLAAREVCPSCGSSHLEEGRLLHHYRCGLQAPRSDFHDGEGLTCPKCRRSLRHYGVDYDSPGEIHACRACNKPTAEPAVSFLCGDCGQVIRGIDVQGRDYFHYDLTAAGELAAEEGRLPRREMVDLLSKLPGWRSARDLALILDATHRVAMRYSRPYVVLSLPLPELDTPRATLGASGVTRLRRALVELVRETIRSPDVLALHRSALIILLPETEPIHGEAVVRRLNDRIAGVLGGGLRLAGKVLEPGQVPALITDLVGEG